MANKLVHADLHANILKSNYYSDESSVISMLKEQRLYYNDFLRMNPLFQQHFLDFFTGKRILPLTYDPVFKRIFHPDIHADRLSQFISCLLGINVKVLQVLPNEDSPFQDSLVIMDILVELEDGSLANVEIQRTHYQFPIERMCCYSSDLLMRQYARVRNEKGERFTYSDIKKVYAIVLFVNSPPDFKESTAYIHHAKTQFDSRINVDFLQEFCIVSLDVFRRIAYAKSDDILCGWLSMLTTDSTKDIDSVITRYPWLSDVYLELQEYLTHPQEVLNMFSEALRILDRNTMSFMIDEMKVELEEKDNALQNLRAENNQLTNNIDCLSAENSELVDKNTELLSTIQSLQKQLAEATNNNHN